MSDWRDRTLPELLAAHGLQHSPERPFPHDGWSGAAFSSLTDRHGRRFVLKRTSPAVDWIARATRDDRLREGWLAALPPGVAAAMPAGALPYLGAAADDEGTAILMPDLSSELLAWERPGSDPVLDPTTLATVLGATARLHAGRWDQTLDTGDGPPPPWCPLDLRLTLLTRPSAARYAAEGNPVGDRFLAGWDAFDRHAPTAARDLLERLSTDVAPLVRALGRLPAVGLHGDLKLANVAIRADGSVCWIDWQMALRAPIAVELGWFLVANSAGLPMAPEHVLDLYADALGDDAVLGDLDAQRDLAWIVGLLLRGWRKGLDAEAGIAIGSGARAADDLAWWCDRAVGAADRRL